jgi:hypothetical protein
VQWFEKYSFLKRLQQCEMKLQILMLAGQISIEVEK